MWHELAVNSADELPGVAWWVGRCVLFPSRSAHEHTNQSNENEVVTSQRHKVFMAQCAGRLQ